MIPTDTDDIVLIDRSLHYFFAPRRNFKIDRSSPTRYTRLDSNEFGEAVLETRERRKKKRKKISIHPRSRAKEKETRASQFLLHLFSASLRGISLLASARQLTNFFRLIILNDLGQLHVPSDHRHLVGSLVRVIQAVLLRASEQQLAYARRVRVVHSAYVQRRVAGRVTRVHVGTVKEQVIQVLDQVVAAGLRTCEGGRAERGRGRGRVLRYRLSKDTRMCDYNYKTLPPLSLCPSNHPLLPFPVFFEQEGAEQLSEKGGKRRRGETEKGEKVKSET